MPSASFAYEPAQFDQCVAALLAILPLQASDRNTGQPSLNDLKSLFQLYLSGTHAPAPQRAAIVDRLVASHSGEERLIGVELLARALKVRGLSSHSSFRFGSRKRDYGWWPRTVDEQRQWHLCFLSIAEQWATDEGEIGMKVRSALGRSVLGLIQDPDLALKLSRLAPRLVPFDGWLEAWESVNRLLKHKGLDDDIRKQATAFEQIVAPSSLRARVLATMTLRDFVASEDEVEGDPVQSYERSQLAAERIGGLLAADKLLLEGLLPQLLRTGAKGNIFPLGLGVGKHLADVPAVITEVRKAIEEASDRKGISLIFVRGLISGWNDNNPEGVSALLDKAVTDPILGPWLPELQMMVPIDARGIERLQHSLRIAQAPVWQYSYLRMGSVLKPVPIDSVQTLLTPLAAKGDDGVHVAIDVLHMVVHSAKERSATERKMLGRFCSELLTQVTWPDLGTADRLDYELEQIIAFATAESGSFEDIRALLDQAVDARTAHPRYYPSTNGNFLAPIIRRYPIEALTHLFGRQDPEHVCAISDLILNESPVNDAGNEHPVVPDHELLQWCVEDPANRSLFAARICRLSEPDQDVPSLVNQLFELASDKPTFIAALARRLTSGGSSERQIPHMELGLRVLKGLPVGEDDTAQEVVRIALEGITQSINWWRRMTEDTGRERAEVFE